MRASLWALLLSLIIALPVSAQETRGNISGTVKDSTGVIPGASVLITSTDTGAKQELVTNSSGYFEAPLVQPGNYQISVAMAGYKSLTRPGIVVAVGQQVNVTLVLAFAETAIVSSAGCASGD